MAKLYNLIRMTSNTTGTGSTIALSAAVSGYLSFANAGVSNGDVIDYAIKDGSSSEIGTAAYSSTGPQLTGRTVTKSTNSNAAINLSGTAEVFVSPRAETLNDASLFSTGALDPVRLNGLSKASAALAADVAIGSVNTYFDGPSINVGTTGIWLVTGSVMINDTGSSGSQVTSKLWDGTTVIASCMSRPVVVGQSQTFQTLSGVVTNPAGNLRISTKSGVTTCTIRANFTGEGKDSNITAIRIG